MAENWAQHLLHMCAHVLTNVLLMYLPVNSSYSQLARTIPCKERSFSSVFSKKACLAVVTTRDPNWSASSSGHGDKTVKRQ